MELVKRLHPGDRHRRAVAIALLAAPFCMAGSVLPAVAWSAAPAAADQISAARQQISQLEAGIVAGAERIHALTAAYDQASFRTESLALEEAGARAEIAGLQAQAGRASAQLRQEALASYTGAYIGIPTALPVRQGSDLSARAEYVSVAAGNLKESVDRLRAGRLRLAAAQTELLAQQRDNNAALAAVDDARRAALAEASADQSRLDALQLRLVDLVSAQRAQAAGAAKSATQGLPVNGGLVTVVTRATQPAPAPAAPANAPPTTSAPAVAPSAPPASVGGSPPSTGSAGTAPAAGDGGAGGVWLQLRECESGDDYQANTGNGFFGAYQFSQQTWTDLGFPGRPDQQPPAMQDAAAQKLQAESGWGQWPACSAALGLS